MPNDEFEFAVVFVLGFATAFGIGCLLICNNKYFDKLSDWMWK